MKRTNIKTKKRSFVVLVLILSSVANLSTAGPIHIGTKKQLFVDDYIIADMDNVYRIMNQPVKYEDNPILKLKPDQKIGGQEHIIANGSVIYDRQERLFKMWYEAANYNWSHNFVGYSYSKDGIHWELPKTWSA